LNNNTDIVGIFGFSQGAAMLSLLTASNVLPKNIKFLIFACGFIPVEFEHKLDIISMHIIGNLDTVILPKFSKELSNIFINPLIIESNYNLSGYLKVKPVYKHDVNCNSSCKKQYKLFIDTVLKLNN
jgi:predicted esterase